MAERQVAEGELLPLVLDLEDEGGLFRLDEAAQDELAALAGRRAVLDGVGAGLADGQFDQVSTVGGGEAQDDVAGDLAGLLDVAGRAVPAPLDKKLDIGHEDVSQERILRQ